MAPHTLTPIAFNCSRFQPASTFRHIIYTFCNKRRQSTGKYWLTLSAGLAMDRPQIGHIAKNTIGDVMSTFQNRDGSFQSPNDERQNRERSRLHGHSIGVDISTNHSSVWHWRWPTELALICPYTQGGAGGRYFLGNLFSSN